MFYTEEEKPRSSRTQPPEVDLTMTAFLLAAGNTLPNPESVLSQAALLQDIAPCRCRRCESLDGIWQELAYARCLFQSMLDEDKSTMLNKCYHAGITADSNHSRVTWRLLGRQTCITHLCDLLGTTPKTLYKRVKGQVDMRINNGSCKTASMSVDRFFIELYREQVEHLPEDDSCHTFNVDEVIEASELGFSESQVPSPPVLEIREWDPNITHVDLYSYVAAKKQLPMKYMQQQKP